MEENYEGIFEDFEILEDIQIGEAVIPRLLPDRSNPLERLSTAEVRRRYRFSPDTIIGTIIPLVQEELEKVTNRGCPLPPLLQVLVTLRFYATGDFQISDGDLHGIPQASVSKSIWRVSDALANHIPHYIKFPGNLNNVTESFHQIANFPGPIIGCIDGTHIPIQCPKRENGEMFRNRKGRFSINVQVVGGPNLEIFDIVSRWPGSAHDSRIFNSSGIKHRLESGELRGFLLGDSRYAQSSYLYTPAPDPELPQRPNQNSPQYALLRASYHRELKKYNAINQYNVAHKSTRNSVERLFGVWKRRFPCLRRTMATKLRTTLSVISACAVLHNIAIRNNDLCTEIDPDEAEAVANENDVDELEEEPIIPQARPRTTGAGLRSVFINNFFM